MKSSIIGVLLRYLATTLSLILIILTFNIQALNYRVLSLLILAVIATLVTPVLYSFIAKHRLHFRVKSIVKAITPKYSVEVEGNKLFIYSGDGKVYGVAFAVVDDIPYTYFDLSRDELVYKIKNFVNVMSSIRDEILLLIIKRSVNETKFILNLERKISTLRVMRRADPTNIKIQRKLEQLEELYSRILKGERPIVVDYILAVKSQGYLKSRVSSELDVKLGNVMSAIEAGLNIRLREALEEEVEYILTFGILSKARSGIKVTSSHIAPFTPVNYTKKPKLDFENGIYLGRDVTTETPVIINIRDHILKHVVILGPTGRGKTTLASILVSKLVNEYNIPCWIIDYRGEYKSKVMVENLTVIKAGEKQINILDYTYTTPKTRAKQVVEAISVVKKLTPIEEYILLNTLIELYSSKSKPTISDLIEYLKSKCSDSKLYVEEKIAIQTLISKLNILSDKVFNSRTLSIPVERLVNLPVVFDLSTIPDEYRDLYAITILQILLNYMTYKGEHKLIAIVVDEAWRILRHSKGRQTLLKFFKEGRGYGLIAIVISQDFNDIPQEILDNVGAIFAFGSHSKDYVERVAKYMNLNEFEKEKMTWLKTGEALLRLYGDPRPIWIRVDEKAVI